MSGMLLNTVQWGGLVPTTKYDRAPEVRGLDPGCPTGLPAELFKCGEDD